MNERAGLRQASSSVLASGGHGRAVPAAIVFAFYVYVVIEYIRPQESLAILGMIRPAMIALIVLGIFSLSRMGSDVYKDTSIRLFIAFVLLSWFSLAHAVNTFWAFQGALSLTMYLLAAVIPMSMIVRDPGSLRKFLVFWVGIHCYLTAYGFLHAGKGPGGFIGDENDLALVLNMALPYSYYLASSRSLSPKMRAAMVAAAMFIAAGVITTMSRGGVVGLAATTVMIILLSKKKLRNAVLIGVGALITYAVVPAQYKAEVSSIRDEGDSTRQQRIFQWMVGWDMFLDNPVIGVGTQNYPWRVVEYEAARAESNPKGRSYAGRAAHSLYFTLLPEYGLAGVLIVVSILWQLAKKLRRAMKPVAPVHDPSQAQDLVDAAARATLVSLVAFLVTGTFISVLYYPPLWYAIGLTYCIAVVCDGISRPVQSTASAPVEKPRPSAGRPPVRSRSEA